MTDPLLLPTLNGVAGGLRPSTPSRSLVVSHGAATWVVHLSDGQPVVLGRDPANAISVNDSRLSRRHASFASSRGAVTVTDLGSTNGTQLNGQPLTGVATLGVGDEVQAGAVSVSLHVVAPMGAPAGGVGTHDQFLAALDDEVERARTFQRSLAVVMVRHQGSAEALASALRGQVRSVDRVATYGDGALELLLPEASAEQVAELWRALQPLLQRPEHGLAIYPADGTSAEALLEASREGLRRGLGDQPPEAKAATGLISASPAMRAIVDLVEQVATSVIPVLLRGETGTGKEVLARAIHERGPRRKQRLMCINCGAIPATLVESVLFGHERGAFTGAATTTRGVFEEADGSTVLLDEVGELSAAAQAALLRVLETKEVRRVGGARDVKVDVRVLAATHRDLEAMVRAGTFREDLLYRLNAMTLEVPPLRERPEEVGPFVEHFVALANQANGRRVRGVDREAMRVLLRYPWPGNIRELRNAVEHAVVIARGEWVQASDLPRKLRDFVPAALDQPPAEAPGRKDLDLREEVQRYERQRILDALRAARGNRTEAARRLQVPLRTLTHKIRQYDLKQELEATSE